MQLKGRTLSKIVSGRVIKDYTDDQYEALKNAPIEEKLDAYKIKCF